MILYYAVTSYHVLCCILHKMTRHSEDEAMLLISDTHPECGKLGNAMEDSGIFQKIGFFPDKGRMLPYKKEYLKNRNKNTLEHLTMRLCNEVEREFPFCPEEITEYNICGDQYSLGIWLIRNEIPYYFFEEGCGVYTRKHLLLENLARLNPFQYDMALQNACMGENRGILKKYIEFSSQEGTFDAQNCVDFSVKNILKNLSREQMNQVKEAFGVPEGSATKEGAVLLLTQQFVNMGFLTVSQEKELYDMMLDYFAGDGTLYVKPHPSDWQGLYGTWYDGAVVFPRFMPSELLPYSIDGKFSVGVTVSSTSIFGLEPYLEHIVCLDSSLEDHYENIHRYYAAGRLLDQIGENISVNYRGKCPKLLEKMVGNQMPGQKIQVEITNRRGAKPQADIVIYMNEDGKDHIPDWMFSGKNHLWPAAIRIKDQKSELTGISYLYVYTENDSLMERMKKNEVRKQLKYSEKEIVVSAEGYQAKCLALEGMLRASNQRIEALLKENEELKKKKSDQI